MTVQELLKERRDDILRIAARHGARNVRVFGSLARGEASKKSDIDILVHMRKGQTLLDFVGLWQDLEDELGCSVDLVSDGGISPYMRDNILRDARPL